MGMLQSVKSFFSNHTETNDHHPDQSLRSHYYKVSSANAFKTIKEFVEQVDGFEVIAAYEERGEISVNVKKGRKSFVVITIVSLRPFETAVDISVTTETKLLPLDFGYSKQVAKSIYSQLNKKLVLVRQGSQSIT